MNLVNFIKPRTKIAYTVGGRCKRQKVYPKFEKLKKQGKKRKETIPMIWIRYDMIYINIFAVSPIWETTISTHSKHHILFPFITIAHQTNIYTN